jgi:hypothetical protein
MKSVIPFLFLRVLTNGFTQEIKTIRDMGAWISIELQYRFNKKWSSGFPFLMHPFWRDDASAKQLIVAFKRSC